MSGIYFGKEVALSAEVSSMFEKLSATKALSETHRVRIVVNLKYELGAISPESLVAFRKPTAALAMLAHAGLPEAELQTSSMQLRHVRPKQKSFSASVSLPEIEQLARLEPVASIRPARIHQTLLDYSVGQLGIDASVRSALTGQGITVAVIDSGIDARHPDFEGRVDLALSRNFTDEGAEDDVSDHNGHGTHVAGIIGGNGQKYRGVAPGVRFIACKVFNSKGRGDEGAVTDAVDWAIRQNVDLINYSGGYAPIFEGYPAVLPPWVWPHNEMEEEAEFRRAAEAGIASVVSAGNWGYLGRGTITAPSTCPSVLSVAAISPHGKPSSFSSVGPVWRSQNVSLVDTVKSLSDVVTSTKNNRKPNLTAPGGEVRPFLAAIGGCFYDEGIISARSELAFAGNASPCDVEPHYVKMAGTSQSAPHITGMAALILEALNSQGVPKGTERVRAIQNTLLWSTVPVMLGDGRKANSGLVGRGLPQWSEVERWLGKLRNHGLSFKQLAR